MALIDLDFMDGHPSYAANAANYRRNIIPPPIPILSLHQLVSAVVARCWRGDRLRRLRIFGHGSVGRQGLGNSVSSNGNFLAAPGRGISWDWIQLSTLANEFDPSGWVELDGCNVGDGSQGKVYVARLAEVLGVCVRAGRGTQWVPAHGRQQFENEWIEAVPRRNGGATITSHAGAAPPPR